MRKIDLANFQVATSETARDINRRIMLNLIRRHQPISRADLARHSGLQRSTVSLITEQLINERWVTEGASGHLPRGRRPRFLNLNRERIGIIGINVRPALTSLGLADVDGNFIAQESLKTPQDPAIFLAEVGLRVQRLMENYPAIAYEGIGISVPGRVDTLTHRIVFAPNLGWRDVELKQPLEEATGLMVELENAANACALAEVWFNRMAENVTNLVAVTVSEGIGCGLLLNGQLVRGTSGLAGEFGHTALIEDGELCPCGNHGCWEVYASNTAAIRYYLQNATGGRRPQTNGRAELAPTFDDILRLALQNDPVALKALDQMAHYIGLGIARLVTGLAPDVIVVVGAVTKLWERIGPIIQDAISSKTFTKALARIVPANSDTQPRLRGTIAMVLQQHFGAPSVA